MSGLRLGSLEMPAAHLGAPNPLPAFSPPKSVSGGMRVDPRIPEADRMYVGYGCDVGCLPHRLQDDYDRVRVPRAFRVAILENDILRATFLLELGGRLWRLLHKPSGRHLLDVNPVFQPGNLAVLNAWFEGGIEWNIGIPGHTPCTCSPLFAAQTRDDDQTPVLRLYEWDRIRHTPYQLDFYLPDNSPWLFVRVTITNPHRHETPMYWWSNIGVSERPGLRVLAPADRAYNFGYEQRMRQAPFPRHEATDVSYPVNIPSARDYFFRIPDDHRPWIAALDSHGRGIVQASTCRLKGRKMFVWGMRPGGRRWQEFLSPGELCFEIQAGLGWTQSECLPMPPGAEWSWLEAYGLMEADPDTVHGPDWHAAVRAVEAPLNHALPQEWLENELLRSQTIANRPPENILHNGSGWGALERRRRELSGEKPFSSTAMVFSDDSLGNDQAPWLALLEHNALPCRDPADLPGAWMVQAEWKDLLQASIRKGHGHWLAWLHLGVMHYHAGESLAAEDAWRKSLALHPSPWACRNLAIAAQRHGRHAEAADLMMQAHALSPQTVPLAVEYCDALIDAGRSQEVITVVNSLPPRLRTHGRLRILKARAALNLGDLETVERILLHAHDIPYIREGEVTLTDLWFAMQEKRLAAAEHVAIDDALRTRVRRDFPPPPHLDFRVTPADA